MRALRIASGTTVTELDLPKADGWLYRAVVALVHFLWCGHSLCSLGSSAGMIASCFTLGVGRS